MRPQSYQKLASLLTLALTSMSATVSATSSEVENTISATSISTCNPLSATSCAADPALATSVSDSFKSSSDNYVPYRSPSQIFYGDDGLTLTLAKRYDNPSLVSDFYIMFGKIEVWLKSAPGTGVISSFYLQSDDLDEIDMEWFGGDVSQMQSNYFSKGNTTTHDRGEYHDMADPRAEFHNYTIDWDESALSWYIDGSLVRTLSNTSSEGYPQSPMRLFFGIWAGGDPSNEEGTIEWAGGETDYTEAPFSMAIEKLIVSDYSTGKEYEYTDTTGEWSSINAVDGEVNGRKVIAMAEFASLVGGSDDASNSIDSISKSSVVSSSPAPSSTSGLDSDSEESTSTSKTEKQKSLDSNSSSAAKSQEKTTATQETSDAESTGTEKTVSLKSKYLSSSTTTLQTATTSKSSSKSSSSSKNGESSTSTITTHSNAANNGIYAGSSFAAVLMLMLSIL